MLETTKSLGIMEPLLSSAQVADLLSVSRLTVYRLIERGLLPVYRVARRLRFTKTDLESYLSRSRTMNSYACKKD